jgi:hypothetical protein
MSRAAEATAAKRKWRASVFAADTESYAILDQDDDAPQDQDPAPRWHQSDCL